MDVPGGESVPALHTGLARPLGVGAGRGSPRVSRYLWRKETKPDDISGNILPNILLTMNMFCIRVISCYLLVNKFGKYFYVHYYFSQFKAYSRHIQGLLKAKVRINLPITLLLSLSHRAGAVFLRRHRNIYCVPKTDQLHKNQYLNMVIVNIKLSYKDQYLTVVIANSKLSYEDQHQSYLYRPISYNCYCQHQSFI